MPVYEFDCLTCNRRTERFIRLAELDALRDAQRCEVCESPLKKVFSLATLRTDTQFLAGSHNDDGFGRDDWSRRQARAKAALAGVNIAGKKFHPGLCRPGELFDPYAWYDSKAEVVRKAEAQGKCVHGAIEHESPIRDADLKANEEPYRVSPDCVQTEVDQEIKQVHGGTVTPKQRREIVEKFVDIHSGRPGKGSKAGIAGKGTRR